MKSFILKSGFFECLADFSTYAFEKVGFAIFAVKKKLLTSKQISLFIIGFLLPGLVFCQEDRLSEVITTVAEELASDESDPEAAVLYIELLNELAENPVTDQYHGSK